MCRLLLVISDSALLPFSATGGGRKATPTNPLKRISLINKFKKFNIKSVLLRLKYLRRVSESVF